MDKEFEEYFKNNNIISVYLRAVKPLIILDEKAINPYCNGSLRLQMGFKQSNQLNDNGLMTFLTYTKNGEVIEYYTQKRVLIMNTPIIYDTDDELLKNIDDIKKTPLCFNNEFESVFAVNPSQISKKLQDNDAKSKEIIDYLNRCVEASEKSINTYTENKNIKKL